MIYFDFQSFSTLLSSVCWWLWEKLVSESGGVSLSIPIAPTRGQQLKKVVTGMLGLLDYVVGSVNLAGSDSVFSGGQ